MMIPDEEVCPDHEAGLDIKKFKKIKKFEVIEPITEEERGYTGSQNGQDQYYTFSQVVEARGAKNREIVVESLQSDHDE